MIERRKCPRVEDDLGVAINLVPEEGPMETSRGNTIFHLTKDISRGGIRFQNDRPLALNALLKIHVALKLPLKTITHFGRVRWVKSMDRSQNYDIGVEFTESPPTDQQLWAHYVDQRLQPSMS
jgi:hypothetical protein